MTTTPRERVQLPFKFMTIREMSTTWRWYDLSLPTGKAPGFRWLRRDFYGDTRSGTIHGEYAFEPLDLTLHKILWHEVVFIRQGFELEREGEGWTGRDPRQPGRAVYGAHPADVASWLWDGSPP